MSKSDRIVRVEEVLKAYAQNYFDVHYRKRLKKTHKDLKDPRKDDQTMIVELEMDNFIIDHARPQWIENSVDQPPAYSLYKTTYKNNTDQNQEYELRTERTSRSVCTYTINKGFSVSKGIELEIGLPDNPAIKSSFKVGKETEKQEERGLERTKEDEVTWGLDTTITVKKNTKTTAALMIVEKQYHYHWKIRSFFDGHFKVIYRLRKNGKELITINGHNLANILTPKSGFSFDDETNRPYLISEGTCSCNFAVEQYIDLQEEPLSEDLKPDEVGQNNNATK